MWKVVNPTFSFDIESVALDYKLPDSTIPFFLFPHMQASLTTVDITIDTNWLV